MKKIIILILLFSFSLIFALDTAIAPKMVYIPIVKNNGGVPETGNILFTCFLTSDNDVQLKAADDNCGYFPLETEGIVYADMTQLLDKSPVGGGNPIPYYWSESEEYRFLITYQNNNTGEYLSFNVYHTLGSGGVDYETSSGFTPLAVTLASFTAVYQDGISILQWQTQSETNNAGWNVYRSESDIQEEGMQINPELLEGHGTTTEVQTYRFEDEDVNYDITYYYWLESVDYSGSNQTYGPITLTTPPDNNNQTPDVPIVYGLHDAYPNPFNPETTINFIMKEPGQAELSIYNIKGQKVVKLFDNFVNKVNEPVSIHWDGKDSSGKVTGSGVYFYQFKTTGHTQIKKMVLVK